MTKGRKALPKNEVKFEVRVFVSELDIAYDNGVSRYIKAMNLVMDKRVAQKTNKKPKP